MPDPYADGIGSAVLVQTSFSSGNLFAICSLSKELDTGANVSVDLSNLESTPGLSESLLDEFVDNATEMAITPALCEHWQTSAQLAMVMEYNIRLEYDDEQLSDCGDLNSNSKVLPLRLSVER